jgi:hypothetical protein
MHIYIFILEGNRAEYSKMSDPCLVTQQIHILVPTPRNTHDWAQGVVYENDHTAVFTKPED